MTYANQPQPVEQKAQIALLRFGKEGTITVRWILSMVCPAVYPAFQPAILLQRGPIAAGLQYIPISTE